MSGQDELSFEKILQFMLQKGGKVTNHELVKHFRVYLTDPANRAEARECFKKHVNTLASIKNQNNEKWLILKRKYMEAHKEVSMEQACEIEPQDTSELDMTFSPVAIPEQPFPEQTSRSPPPYKPPPEVTPKHSTPNTPVADVCITVTENTPEQVQPEPPSSPRDCDGKSNEAIERSESPSELHQSSSSQENIQHSDEVIQLRSDVQSRLHVITQQITSPPVKERKKMFSRSNGEGETFKSRSLSTRKSSNRSEYPKRASVMPHLDAKGHQWIVRASAADFETLSKMCEEDPNLVRLKDPITGTALHWACKHGDERIVKLLATIARSVVHEKTNGGYSPLHIAMQFRHENIYKILVDVFDADPNVVDYSGRKPREYPVVFETWNPNSITKKSCVQNFVEMEPQPSVHTNNHCELLTHIQEKSVKTAHSDKDQGFLRFGSLNLRVKKTTEAVTSFLGVRSPKSEQEHRPGNEPEDFDFIKPWASAENIPAENWTMGLPPALRVRKTRRHRPCEAQSRSTPTTPNQSRAKLPGSVAVEGDGETPGGTPMGTPSVSPADSDSDSAAGFHAGWQAKRNSAH